jgi:hypothetical protein
LESSSVHAALRSGGAVVGHALDLWWEMRNEKEVDGYDDDIEHDDDDDMAVMMMMVIQVRMLVRILVRDVEYIRC